MTPVSKRSELHKSLVHVRYTMDQLVAIIYWKKMEQELRLQGKQLPEMTKAIFRNACLDSTLFSLRILDEFFDLPRRDRLTAADYGFPIHGGLLGKKERTLINNHVSHLTWKRVHDPILSVFGELVLSALPLCEQFLAYLVSDFLQPGDTELDPVSHELRAFQQGRAFFKI